MSEPKGNPMSEQKPIDLNNKRQAWQCKIGVVSGVEIPPGGDAPDSASAEKMKQCPFCDLVPPIGTYVAHPISSCVLSGFTIRGYVWNNRSTTHPPVEAKPQGEAPIAAVDAQWLVNRINECEGAVTSCVTLILGQARASLAEVERMKKRVQPEAKPQGDAGEWWICDLGHTKVGVDVKIDGNFKWIRVREVRPIEGKGIAEAARVPQEAKQITQMVLENKGIEYLPTIPEASREYLATNYPVNSNIPFPEVTSKPAEPLHDRLLEAAKAVLEWYDDSPVAYGRTQIKALREAIEAQDTPRGPEAIQVVCPWCHGNSSLNQESGCTTCGGHGWIWEQVQAPGVTGDKGDAHPIQPLQIVKGALRFKENRIVSFLLDHNGHNMNDISVMDFPREDRVQFAQLIGYSLNKFSKLPYVTDEEFNAAERCAKPSDITPNGTENKP